jgi:hypothetical protein
MAAIAPVQRLRAALVSRISHTSGSLASERAFHVSQSLLTLRQTRLAVSLPIAPPKNSVRRTRRETVRDTTGDQPTSGSASGRDLLAGNRMRPPARMESIARK